MSNRFPTNGSGRGPGGSDVLLKRHCAALTSTRNNKIAAKMLNVEYILRCHAEIAVVPILFYTLEGSVGRQQLRIVCLAYMRCCQIEWRRIGRMDLACLLCIPAPVLKVRDKWRSNAIARGHKGRTETVAAT